MTLFTRTLLVATIVAGTTLATTTDAEAGCGGSRRSYFRPRIAYQPRPVYHPPAQPVYQQPISQPVQQLPPQQLPPQQQQPQLPQQPQQPQQPIASQPTQPAQQATPPAQSTNPVASQPTQPQTNAAAPSGNASMTALQALASMSAIPSSNVQTPAQPQQPTQVGTWNAQLSNGARVQLKLQSDGSFSWTPTNQSGRSSSFAGSYSIANGSLTLTRSTDSQKLGGTLTQKGSNSFNFKLAGTNDGGLNFVRA